MSKDNIEKKETVTVNLSYTQVEFLRCKLQLKLRQTQLEEGTLSKEDYDNGRKQILQYLWSLIENYARFVLHNECKLSKNPTTEEFFEDALSECYITFQENLDKYDPIISAPTTYYKQRFIRAGFECVNKNLIGQFSEYYHRNAKLINKVIDDINAQGGTVDYQLIAEQTNLSEKVIQSTVKRMQNRNLESIENQEYKLQDNAPTPEQLYIEKEERQLLMDACMQVLSPQDFNLLLRKINCFDNQKVSYKSLADDEETSIRDIKQRINNAKIRLSKQPYIKSQYGERYGSDIYMHYSFQNKATDIAEAQLLDYFENINDSSD